MANRLKFAFSLLPFAMLFASCVPVEQLPPGAVPSAPATTATSTTFADLEPGNTSVTSTHFTVKGYSQSDLETLKQLAENYFNKIGSDTGLYSFLASENYTIVAYRDRDEFMKKTRQPSWSHAVSSGKTISIYYPDPDLDASLIHQLTHVIFESYMGDKATNLRWLEEGLAMYEEVSKMPDIERTSYVNSKATQLRQNRVPFSQMTFFVTNTEEKRRTDGWYQQVESVISYMLSQGSALAFAQMLSELRTGTDINQALSDAYSSKFRSLDELENLWKYTI